LTVRIEEAVGERALTEFVLFHDRVYEYRSARWRATLPLQLPALLGQSPFAEGREMKPFQACDGDRIVARALAMVDGHYNRHWNDRLGHIAMFEALPGAGEAVAMLMDEACRWLESRGAQAARAGWGTLEFPFVIDEYEALPPGNTRQNPPYYHKLLKDAGFETEKGWVDYKIEVTPELAARYERALEAARRAGFAIVPVKDVDPDRRVHEFTATWNDAFKTHWGVVPFTEAEVGLLYRLFAVMNGLDTSAIAYRGSEPVGTVMVVREMSDGALLAPGRVLKESEKLNFLGIGVRESARGQGVNLALAAYAYLRLIDMGAKFLSYTLVLDDNWPSRRTAEKLGAKVCANYVVYRRNFRR
jgi:GNAT superfamily N-acetyltransferase